ncbi:MAG: hypothetical protein ACPGWR_26060 [Ardenticatenaceae bacterium]
MMNPPAEQEISYNCPKCGHKNRWKAHQIRQRNKKDLLMDPHPDYDIYLLRCQNPHITCNRRRKIGLLREENTHV